jgi:hypothetical protein
MVAEGREEEIGVQELQEFRSYRSKGAMANLLDPKPTTKDEEQEEEEYDEGNETLNRNKPWATLSCPSLACPSSRYDRR